VREAADTGRASAAEWTLLGLLVLVLGGVLGQSAWREWDDAERRERERLGAQATVVNDLVAHQLAAAASALRSLRAEVPRWRAEPGGLEAAAGRLRALEGAMPAIRTLLVLDADGRIEAANREGLAGQRFDHREYFKAARQRPDPAVVFVSPPFRTMLGVWTLNLSVAVIGPAGEFAGVVTASLDPEELQVVLGAVRYAPDVWSALVHGRGILFLMVPEREGLAGKDLAVPGSLFSAFRASGQPASVVAGTVYATGERRLIAQQVVRPEGLTLDHELVVAVSRDLDAVRAPLRRGAARSGLLLAVILVGGASGLALFQRRRRAALEERRRAEREVREALRRNEQLVVELRDALDQVKTLTGLLPVCMYCHKIRDDEGAWSRMEEYIAAHTDATFSHGLCPECFAGRFPPTPDDAG
jgi:hypothetical protein